jgi:hypothetical protein
MSLNWDSSRCKAGDTPANEVEHGWRECLIWGSICIDIGQITDENVDEVLFRYRFMERIGESVTTQPMTKEAIQRWVGLRTNVANMTRAKWISKMTKRLGEDIEREIKQKTVEVAV